MRSRSAIGDAVLIDVDEQPFEMPAPGSVRTTDGNSLDPHDPSLQALLDDWIADAERRWLDEHIPALGGRTPRQAADDPVAREELRRLLASFPPVANGAVGAMDPDRLRAALGL